VSVFSVPRLFVHDDGRIVISVTIGEGIGHGVGFRWLLIDGTEQRWVEPMTFPDFTEVLVMHPRMIQKGNGRSW
jgi:hypothetical protein